MADKDFDIKKLKIQKRDEIKALASYRGINQNEKGVVTHIFRNGPNKYYDIYFPDKGVVRLSSKELAKYFTFAGEKENLWKELQEAHSRGEYPEWTLDSPLSTDARPYRFLYYLYKVRSWVTRRELALRQYDEKGEGYGI